ncbi:hypothetical protein PTKIN_Ptkin13bG0264500 [Pterospermum kingtungense]
MATIRFISSSIIQAKSPKKETETERIELTPWDLKHLLSGYLPEGLLFHKPKPQAEEQGKALIHHLETSLSRTLDFFPPLAGRIATIEYEDKTTSFFIDCNNAGALFVHAEAEGVTISDVVKPVYVPCIVSSFFPLSGLKNCDGIFKPLLGVQVTELVDGIFVGVTINHCVADGVSFWHFFNSWSEISRGSFHLSNPPVFQRPFLDSIKYPIRIPQSLFKQIFHEELIFVSPLKEKIFHFSKPNIAKLKAKANAEVGTDNISSLQALLSHFWRSVIRNKKIDPGEEMKFVLQIDARPRMRELPEEYFGNAVQSGSITMKATEVQGRRVGDIAREMNKMIATHTEDELKKYLEYWIANPEQMTKPTIKTNRISIASSPRFNMYGNDFGWGRPIAVKSGAAIKYDGKLILYCGAEEGSIDIEACLLPETFDAMANDQEFMDTVTI